MKSGFAGWSTEHGREIKGARTERLQNANKASMVLRQQKIQDWLKENHTTTYFRDALAKLKEKGISCGEHALRNAENATGYFCLRTERKIVADEFNPVAAVWLKKSWGSSQEVFG